MAHHMQQDIIEHIMLQGALRQIMLFHGETDVNKKETVIKQLPVKLIILCSEKKRQAEG